MLHMLYTFHNALFSLQLRADQTTVTDNIPDLFHFRLTGMNRLVQHYGAGSQPVLDAHRLLNTLLNKVSLPVSTLEGAHSALILTSKCILKKNIPLERR